MSVILFLWTLVTAMLMAASYVVGCDHGSHRVRMKRCDESFKSSMRRLREQDQAIFKALRDEVECDDE